MPARPAAARLELSLLIRFAARPRECELRKYGC
jgi:hypothetical protein